MGEWMVTLIFLAVLEISTTKDIKIRVGTNKWLHVNQILLKFQDSLAKTNLLFWVAMVYGRDMQMIASLLSLALLIKGKQVMTHWLY